MKCNTICIHHFGWLSERGGNFLNLLQKKEGTQKGGGVPSEKRGSSPGGDCAEVSSDKIQNKMILTVSIKFIDSDIFTGSIF